MIAYLFRFFKGLCGFKNLQKFLNFFEEISKKVLTNKNESDIIYTVSERDTNLSEK